MTEQAWSDRLGDNEFQLIWNKLTFTANAGTKDERVIIRNTCGRLQSGQIMAFLGPSGSGKSTLMECLIRKRMRGVSGNIFLRKSSVINHQTTSTDTLSGSTAPLVTNSNQPNRKSANMGANQVNMSFIAQRDDLFGLLTVRESILYAAKLQISKKKYEKSFIPSVLNTHTGQWVTSDASNYFDLLCNQIINQLGLQEVANNRVSICSGGQQKRVSIGQELPSRPRILILDEPTSGLDSNASYALIGMLKTLTQDEPSVAIMLSIHQPSVKLWQTFDLAYVISRTGRCVYQGAPDALANHLTQFNILCPQYTNVGDYIIEIVSDVKSNHIEQLAQNHQMTFDSQFDEINRKELATFDRNRPDDQKFPELQHTWILTKRSVVITFRDPLVFGLRLITHFATGGFYVVLYGPTLGTRGGCSPQMDDFEPSRLDWMTDEIDMEIRHTLENLSSFLFALVILAFMAIMPVVISFPLEVRVFSRQKANRWYSLKAYFFAKNLSEVPFQLLLPSMFAFLFYLLSSQPLEFWRCANFVGFSVLCTFVAQSFGYVMGAAFMNNVTTALFFGPLTLFPLLLLSGAMLKLKDLPMITQIISACSYFRWALSGIVVAVYGYGRCGMRTNQQLRSNREAFQVWLAALLGVYDEPEVNAGTNNGSTVGLNNAPSERFVNNLVSTITNPFISDSENIQSLAMNQLDLTDIDLYLCWMALFVYFLCARTVVYFVLKYKTSQNDI